MIPIMNTVGWSRVVPWVDLRQVEQDLIIHGVRSMGSDPINGLRQGNP
jgi:hypothetical protein